ncbi:hypothetical protein [Cerasicoccus frondis]|uniref:hypothetical protein n=1 Tax=Cerasicoccus frondis TaxID=490090 RepID=UPI002852A1B8|nr:hypothetical protein [Cerasicoccus frondis]
MGFILTLILSLSTILQTEVAISGTTQVQSRARQAALLSLNTAIGNLQSMAGPDQRTTARADILEGGYSGLIPVGPKQNWTGVWRTDDVDPLNPGSKTFVGWLASVQDNEEVLGEIESGLVDPRELVSQRVDSEGNIIAAVKADVISVPESNMEYAWVVLDEGVKAKVNARTWEEEAGVYAGEDQLRQSLRFGPSESAKAGVLSGLESFNTSIPASIRSHFSDVSELDIELGAGVGDPYIHDLTLQGFGLLVDVKNGGLRRDLSRGLNDQLSELSGKDVISAFPMKWDSLAAWATMYKLLDDPAADVPTLKPRDTLPASWTGAREEFNASNINSEDIALGGIEGWELTSHPIAPVVQQFIWRIGGLMVDYYNEENVRWEWRSDRPSPGGADRNNREKYTNVMTGRHVLSPLVVLWNPYNVALDASDYRISYDLDADMQIVVRDPDTSDKHSLYNSSESIIDLWQANESTTRSGHFTMSLFEDYNRNGKENLNQTVLQPGEMKIFALHFADTTSGSWQQVNDNSGGFGKWGNQRLPTQLIGPENGIPHNGFRSVVGSRDIDLTKTHSKWIFDSLDLDFGSNQSATDPNDFRMTLALTDANYNGGDPNPGFVVRDVWGLRPPANYSGNFPFSETTDGTQNLSLYRYTTILGTSNTFTSATESDMFYAASIVARLNTSDAEMGADSVPFIANYNPLAWHTRPSDSDEVYSPIWDVSVYNRIDWNSYRYNNSVVNAGIPKGGNSITSFGQDRVILKEIPRQPLLSVGQFMHAEIGVFDTVPLYTVGSSYAPPFGPRNQVIYDGAETVDGLGTNLEAIDLSWYYNDVLFDSYFFSTVPEPGQSVAYPPFEDFDLDYVGSGKKLPNSRYHYYSKESLFDSAYMTGLRDIDTAASSLIVDGAFNVNSTSVEAWKSVLATLLQSEDFRYFDLETNSIETLTPADLGIPVPRFMHPLASNESAQDGDTSEAWTGFRSLDDAELTALSEAIVEQVKLRGPFRSLSDFINRRLVADDTGSKGALQAALDDTVNNVDDFGGEPTQSKVWGTSVDWDDHAPSSGAGAPGWVMQNDILQVLAPVLSARSDTFRIRAYGAALNPLTQEPEGTAMCEAIVQRVPDYIDGSQTPEETPITAENIGFGRKFIIVSFRWLTEDEV